MSGPNDGWFVTAMCWLMFPLRMWRARQDLLRLGSGGEVVLTPLERKYGMAHYRAMVNDPSVTTDFRAWAAEQESKS